MAFDDFSAPHLEAPIGFRGLFRADLAARARYAEGAGIARCVPHAVAVPRDVDDVGVLVRWAKRNGVPLVSRGSGSGMAAGAVGPGVLVDLSRFRQIDPVDVTERRLRVGAGVTQRAIDAAARRHGLRFPVDPSSGAFCTIGGMVATNAAGARSLAFGATRPWVLGVQAVFDDGEPVWIRRDQPLPGTPAVTRLTRALEEIRRGVAPVHLVHEGVRKESSGYGVAAALAPTGHLVDLLVGSEGTLALFTAVEVALCPVPGAVATVLATFPSLDRASTCAVDARADGAVACELLDRTFLDVAETGAPTGIPLDAEAVLLTELEGQDPEQAAAAAKAFATRARRHGAVDVQIATERDAAHRLWALRHAASPILARLAPRVRSMQFIEDGCVPPDRFPAYVRGVRTALDVVGLPGVIFGHAGDAHAHVNPLVDTTRRGWRDQVRDLLDAVCDLTAALGGTLAGEHGDGRLRAPLWPSMWSLEARAAFAQIKSAADPAAVLNPGCKVADADALPFTTVRHDPEAPPLPADARAVLDAIERDRAWDRWRLEGLADVSFPHPS